MRPDELLAYDRAHVWHPYASMMSPASARLIESASGVRLKLADGSDVIDAMSSWWCAIHGYRHPVLDAAAHAQIERMSHVMFGGLTHEPAVVLARRLVELTPSGLEHVFFADSGSVAVEVAIKMCLQYQRKSGRSRLLTVRGGYHGDTLAAMSVCDPVDGMHQLFSDVVPGQVFAPRPPSGFAADIEEWTAKTTRLVSEHSGELAAIIVEPVVQGAGGMHIYPPKCLTVLRNLADQHGLLLVFDEIATGFGRTGEMFAMHHAGVVPDIVCVGKALTGGYLTLAAVLCTSDVARGVSSAEAGGALMHGPTFMANPLACAVALANLDLLIETDWRTRVKGIEARLAEGLAPATELLSVRDVRVLGAVGVVQTRKPVDVEAVTAAALERGVWVRPFRDLVYTMPPYICTDDDIATITSGIVGAVAEAVR